MPLRLIRSMNAQRMDLQWGTAMQGHNAMGRARKLNIFQCSICLLHLVMHHFGNG